MYTRLFIFALTYWMSTPALAENIVLENFESYPDLVLKSWSEGNKTNGTPDYTLQKQDKNTFLRGKFIIGADGKAIYKKIKWNSHTHPFLSWRWRVNHFPKGSDIFVDGKSDAAVQIYVSWNLSGRRFALKYFWTETNVVGTSFHTGKWNPIGRYFGLILRSGGKTNEWVTEKRNVYEDFVKAFERKPPVEAEGIGLLTDGDGTLQPSEGDYDDFVVTVK